MNRDWMHPAWSTWKKKPTEVLEDAYVNAVKIYNKKKLCSERCWEYIIPSSAGFYNKM